MLSSEGKKFPTNSKALSMKFSAPLLLVSVIAGNNALAHSDRLLPIRPDGTMPALPSKFGPATLKINFSAALSKSPPITSVVLNLGENRIELPACITDVLRSRRLEQVEASASWYHNEVDLPYYLNLNFFDPGYTVKKWANPGVRMLFNLRTGKIMHIGKMVVRDKGQSLHNVGLDLGSRCPPHVLAALMASRQD